MRAILFAALALAGCASRDQANVESSVRAFAATVAHDVTQNGPIAWRKHFADTPAFFMAVDGHMAFPNSGAATTAIQDLTRTIKHIELQWGNDLRIDPLSPDLAMLATSWHEVIVNTTGSRVEQAGFFTGVVERRDGHWQFRDAHWSVAH